MPPEFLTNEQIIVAARRNVEQGLWDYLTGGSESETTLRRNRAAFDSIAFRPRILVDVSRVDASTTFIGQKLRMPVVLAPIGSLQAVHPEGAVASSKAAEQFGTVHVVSSATQPAAEVTAAGANGPRIFQLYVRGDKAWLSDLMQRVHDSGYIGLCFTVDTAVDSRRERPMLTGWIRPTRRNYFDPIYQAELTWEEMDEIAAMAQLPVLIKGIATAADARIALEHGAKVIWVSNHGGRQLDHGLGTMDYLREIVEAVDGRAEIIVDGGVQRGTDVLKAIAYGATAVAIGRLQVWGLAAAGVPGLLRVLEILEAELLSAMGLLGITSIDQLDASFVTEAEPVLAAHEMSAFPNIMGGRVY